MRRYTYYRVVASRLWNVNIAHQQRRLTLTYVTLPFSPTVPDFQASCTVPRPNVILLRLSRRRTTRAGRCVSYNCRAQIQIFHTLKHVAPSSTGNCGTRIYILFSCRHVAPSSSAGNCRTRDVFRNSTENLYYRFFLYVYSITYTIHFLSFPIDHFKQGFSNAIGRPSEK